MKHYKSVEEITNAFIDNGWSEDISFTELSRKDAESKGHLFIAHDISNGKKYFVMNGSGNIFDDTGRIALFNIDTVKR